MKSPRRISVDTGIDYIILDPNNVTSSNTIDGDTHRTEGTVLGIGSELFDNLPPASNFPAIVTIVRRRRDVVRSSAPEKVELSIAPLFLLSSLNELVTVCQ